MTKSNNWTRRIPPSMSERRHKLTVVSMGRESVFATFKERGSYGTVIACGVSLKVFYVSAVLISAATIMLD